MLVPAVTYRDEIINEIQKLYYTDYYYRYQVGIGSSIPNIYDSPEDGIYQYAIINKEGLLVGYFSYMIDGYSSKAYNLGLIEFNKEHSITLRNIVLH